MKTNVSAPTPHSSGTEYRNTVTYALMMTFPILALYHIGAYYEGAAGGVEKQVVILWALQWLFTYGGMAPWQWGTISVAILCVLFAWSDHMKHGVFGRMRAMEFAGILAESIFLALGLALIMGFVVVPKLGHWPLFFDTRVFAQKTFLAHWTNYAHDIGAAFYETLAFPAALLIVGGLLLKRILPAGAYLVPLMAASTYAFAVLHFFPDVSPERPLSTGNVATVMIMGFYFAFVYVHRGFAVAAWTHAIYNAMFTTLFLKIII